VGVRCGSGVYWLVVLLQIPFLAVVTYIAARWIEREHRQKVDAHFPFVVYRIEELAARIRYRFNPSDASLAVGWGCSLVVISVSTVVEAAVDRIPAAQRSCRCGGGISWHWRWNG